MDTAPVIFTPTNLAQPLRLTDLFPREQPLDLEIGCGKGRFLITTATRNPDRNFIGIERLLLRARTTSAKAARAGLTNVRILRIEASYALRYLLPASSVSVCHVFFPDPWPKRRHHRRRLVQPDFLDLLERILVPGGQINLATDHLDYLAAMRQLFLADRRFHETEAFVPPEDAVSEFEQRFRARNLPIGRLSFLLTDSAGGGAAHEQAVRQDELAVGEVVLDQAVQQQSGQHA